MQKRINLYLNPKAQIAIEKIDEELQRLNITRSAFFQTLMYPLALRLTEMKKKTDIFNGDLGPLKIKL